MLDGSICIIPARGGSKEVPRKNIRLLNGKPLIYYTIETAHYSNVFSGIFVSTDDDEIAKLVTDVGIIPIKRKKVLATDMATFDDVLIDVVKKLDKEIDFKYVVARDCTVPFVNENDIIEILKVLKNQKCDSVFSMCESHPNPYFGMFEQNESGFLRPSKTHNIQIKRRQDAPKVYSLNGVYAIKKDVLLNGEMFTDKILGYEIEKTHGFMIDTELDFVLAEALLKNLYYKQCSDCGNNVNVRYHQCL